jgi:hypothetical protein
LIHPFGAKAVQIALVEQPAEVGLQHAEDELASPRDRFWSLSFVVSEVVELRIRLCIGCYWIEPAFGYE